VVELQEEVWLQGRPIVPGIAFGPPFLLNRVYSQQKRSIQTPLVVEEEIQRFFHAVTESQKELRTLADKLRSKGFCQEADLVNLHLHMAGDPALCSEIEAMIRQSGQRAERVVEEMVEQLRKRFEELPDPAFRERFEDVEGVCHRILSVLETDIKGGVNVSIPSQSILFARTLTASVAAELSVHGVNAIVTMHGGSMSHTAIVARARGIPYVTDIELSDSLDPEDAVIVDGATGVVILRPTEETISRYENLKTAHEIQMQQSSLSARLESTTKDGAKISLFANVSRVHEIYQISPYGLSGVGLYRTEYLVLEKKRFPSEQEQTEAYAEMVKAAEGKPVVIRVFDFGSDKGWDEVMGVIPAIHCGCRAISLLLEHPPIFRAHLRSIIRAAKYGKISVLFPMISSIGELNRCLVLLREAWESLSDECTLSFPRVGAMIELPVLAFSIASLQGKVDFISVGTNDLIQYALAIDRSNTMSCDHRVSCHPGFLQLLRLIVQDSQKVDLSLCLCGELASDPLFIPLLIGLGIRQLSITPRLAPMVKHVLRSFTTEQAEQLCHSVFQKSSAQEIYQALQAFQTRLGIPVRNMNYKHI